MLEWWRPGRAVHNPGEDCGRFGVSRLSTSLAADAPRALKAIRAARAGCGNGRGRWLGCRARAGGRPVTMDIDATLATAFSEKEQATPAWKKMFGFHPLTVFADYGAEGAGEPLAIVLGPGNAGSSTAVGYIEAARLGWRNCPVTCSGGC